MTRVVEVGEVSQVLKLSGACSTSTRLLSGDNVGPVLTVQETGQGIKITGVLRNEITSDLVVRVNVGEDELDTITIPLDTEVNTEVSCPSRPSGWLRDSLLAGTL
jgi:hypothetical protein